MAATGYTPISLYYSTTAAAVPTNTNLVNGELAINITDGKLYYKDNSGVVQLLASKAALTSVDSISFGTTGLTPSTATTGAVTVAGTLNVANGGTGLTSLTAGYIPFGNGTSAFSSSSSFSYISGVLDIGGTSGATVGERLVVEGANSAGHRSARINNTSTTNGYSTLWLGAANDGILRGGSTAGAFTDQLAILTSGANPITLYTNNTERMRVATNGYVGINTTTPSGILDVVSASVTRLLLGYNGTSVNYFDGDTQIFRNAAATERMRIDSSGNVGIGTSSPVSSGGYTSLTLNNATNSGYVVLQTNGVTTSDWYVSGGSIATFRGVAVPISISSTGANYIALSTNSAERMRIDSTGNVGIGTASPGFGLVVEKNNGSGYVAGFRADSSSPYLTIQTTGGVTQLQALNSTVSAVANIGMQISGGNVGIGTASPTALLQTTGNSSTAAFKTPNIVEVATVSATAATGTINYDCTTQSVVYYTTNASGNWTINFRGSSGTSLNTIMATGESMSFTFLATQGSTAYYNSAVQVDGTTSGVTTKWQGGTAPTSGNASSIDSYTYVVIKTANATFTVLASQTKFA